MSLQYKLQLAWGWQMMIADKIDSLPLIWKLQESRAFLEDLFSYGSDRKELKYTRLVISLRVGDIITN